MFMYVPMVFPASLLLDNAIPHIPGGLRWGLTIGIVGSALSVRSKCSWKERKANFMGQGIVRALSNQFWLVWIGQFIGAAVQPFILNAPPMLAANWFPADQRTLATTICSVANPIGRRKLESPKGLTM